jgi:MFS family permease
MAHKTSEAEPKTFYGWLVVAAAFVLAVFGWGLGFYGPPVYLHAVREARGWSVAVVSTAVTVHFLLGAVVVANLPKLYRRFGLPAVTKAGAVSLALGLSGWANAEEPWQLLLLGVALFGFGIGNATSFPPLIAQVEFTKADVSRVVPLIVATGQATYAFAPAVFGVVRTLGPQAAPQLFVLAAAIQTLAIAAFLAGRHPLNR